VGPLGKEFPIEKYGTVLLGGGCYGIAAIYPIAKALKAVGNHVIMVLEAKSKKLFYLEKEIENIANEVVYCTSDGSKGIKGKIGTCLRFLIDQGKHIDKCHFVGCNYMMMEASNFTKMNGPISTSVLLKTIMIDGTGMCGGCRLTLIEGDKELTKFACVDGPIFDGHKVNWNELISRGQRFDYQETQIFQTHSCKATELLREAETNEQQ
jgi:NAD(P)H-flavin reductase